MENSIKRYESLDIFRGLCALSIMAYHYFGWTLGHFDASQVLGRFGVYGVSMFYVLSGLTMYLVYFHKFQFDKPFLRDFFIKRFFRIYPLMLLVIIISFLIFGTINTFADQILIGTGLFSVLKWDALTPLGMWSIGNELSFYLMLPIIFFALKKGLVGISLISLVIFGLYFYFAFFVFNYSAENLMEDRHYKNPLNQAGLFLGGILIGYFFKNRNFKDVVIILILLISCFAFCFYPSNGPLRNIYIADQRVVFTFICFVIAFSVFKLDVSALNRSIKRPFIFLGEISYSVYLMHGMMWSIIVLTGLKIRYVLPLSILGTFAMSYIVYRFFETPARNFGYKILEKINKQNK